MPSPLGFGETLQQLVLAPVNGVYGLRNPDTGFVSTETVGRIFGQIGVIVFIMIVELLNTAIEKLCDRVTRDDDPVIKRVKDMGSAAVGLALLIAAMAWLLALAERFGLI